MKDQSFHYDDLHMFAVYVFVSSLTMKWDMFDVPDCVWNVLNEKQNSEDLAQINYGIFKFGYVSLAYENRKKYSESESGTIGHSM